MLVRRSYRPQLLEDVLGFHSCFLIMRVKFSSLFLVEASFGTIIRIRFATSASLQLSGGSTTAKSPELQVDVFVLAHLRPCHVHGHATDQEIFLQLGERGRPRIIPRTSERFFKRQTDQSAYQFLEDSWFSNNAMPASISTARLIVSMLSNSITTLGSSTDSIALSIS